MTKAQTVLYSIAFALIFLGAPAVIEGYPRLAFGMIAVAGVCVRIAERRGKKWRRTAGR